MCIDLDRGGIPDGYACHVAVRLLIYRAVKWNAFEDAGTATLKLSGNGTLFIRNDPQEMLSRIRLFIDTALDEFIAQWRLTSAAARNCFLTVLNENRPITALESCTGLRN